MEDPSGDQPKPPAMEAYVKQSNFELYIQQLEAMRVQEKEKNDRDFAAKEEELKNQR